MSWTVDKISVCRTCYLIADDPGLHEIPEDLVRDFWIGLAGMYGGRAESVHCGEELGYSWASCEACSSNEGGDRHQLIVWYV